MDKPLCLIVDDEAGVRSYLSDLLQCKGIQSVEAENAAEGLRILQKRRGEIDLLITDIHMPGDMDGLDLADSVRNSFSSVPVIVISADEEEAPNGVTFVRKPFKANAILSVIDKTIRSRMRAGGVR